jgi:predicted GIY-YIG superfamily endonuclease
MGRIDIIFNESAELKKQLKEKEEQLQLKENDLEAQKLLVKKKDKELKQMAKKISLDWLYVAVTDNVQGVSKIGITEEILKRIDGHLNNNIDSKLIKQKDYFKTSFREELLKIIETFIGVKAIKRTNNSKRNGYSFFTGIKLIIK